MALHAVTTTTSQLIRLIRLIRLQFPQMQSSSVPAFAYLRISPIDGVTTTSASIILQFNQFIRFPAFAYLRKWPIDGVSYRDHLLSNCFRRHSIRSVNSINSIAIATRLPGIVAHRWRSLPSTSESHGNVPHRRSHQNKKERKKERKKHNNKYICKRRTSLPPPPDTISISIFFPIHSIHSIN